MSTSPITARITSDSRVVQIVVPPPAEVRVARAREHRASVSCDYAHASVNVFLSDAEFCKISIDPADFKRLCLISVPLGSCDNALRTLRDRGIELDDTAWHLVRSIRFSARSYSLKFLKATPMRLGADASEGVPAIDVYRRFEDQYGCFRCTLEDALVFVLGWTPKRGEVAFIGSVPTVTNATGILRYVFGYGCLWNCEQNRWIKLLFGSSLCWLTPRDPRMSWVFLET